MYVTLAHTRTHTEIDDYASSNLNVALMQAIYRDADTLQTLQTTQLRLFLSVILLLCGNWAEISIGSCTIDFILMAMAS